MRKLFSVILVVAMVLGLVSTAFAATPTDVAGTTSESAVNRLLSLGILTGYEDGTFKPNNNITRAEFAAVAVRALGLEDAAKAAVGTTKFKDVDASHWASGYINVAVDRGIITGYPDGTFVPSANVTNAEAEAMLVRVLGYQPVVSGVWPMNYVSKAAEIGITRGMNLVAGTAAIRGNVAIMTSNSLTIPLMVQEYFGQLNSWVVRKDMNLLNTNLSVTEYKEAIVYATPLWDRLSLKANQVKIQPKLSDGTYGTAVKFTNVSGTDVEPLLGHQVTAWVRNDEVVAIADTTAPEQIVTFTSALAAGDLNYPNAGGPVPDDVQADRIVDQKGDNDKTNDAVYMLASSPVVYLNHVREANYATAESKLNYATLTLILNSDNQVRFVYAMKYETPVVVTKVVSTGSEPYIEYYGTNIRSKSKYLIANAVYNVVDNTGKAMTLADIQPGDVVRRAANDVSARDFWFEVTRSTIEGTVTKVVRLYDWKKEGDTADRTSYWRVYVGDTAYRLESGATQLSEDGKTSFAIDTPDKMQNLVGYTGTFTLSHRGRIRLVAAEAPDNGISDAFVTKAPYDSGEYRYIKVIMGDGTKKTLKLDEECAETDLDLGNFVELTMNEDGVVTEATLKRGVSANLAEKDIKTDTNRVTVGSSTYAVTSDTKVFQVAGDPLAVTEKTWAEIEDNNFTDNPAVTVELFTEEDSTTRIAYIVVKESLGDVMSDGVMLVNRYKDAKGTYHVEVLDADGVKHDYKLTTSTTLKAKWDAWDYGTVKELAFDSSDFVKDISPVVADEETDKIVINGIEVDGIDTDVLSITDGSDVYLGTEDCVVYDYRDSAAAKVGSWNDLAEDQWIDVYLNTDGDISFIVIQADEPFEE